MTKMIFCIYDSAAAMYLDCFVAPTAEFAIREFRSAVNKPGHQFCLYPGDYTLFLCGQFDAETGNLLPQNPVSLGVGVTFVEKEVSDG